MKETVYISGHQNPDTDSICAAIGYAEFKRKRNEYNAVPIRLGELSQETKYVLDYFNVPAPLFKDTMQPQVKDLKMDNAYCITPEISIMKALELINEHKIDSLPIIDYDENLVGVATLSNLTGSYIDVWDDNILGRSGTMVENIMDVLTADFIIKPQNPRPMNGKMVVHAMKPESTDGFIMENDIVITGDRKEAQEDAINKKVSLLIITGGLDLEKDLYDKALKNNVSVIHTDYTSFIAARILPQAVPVSHVMTKDELVYFHQEDYLDDVQHVMSNTRFRAYPVLDHQNKVIGSISRYHLLSNKKKKLILVDHNEKTQSIGDIEDAEIIEIVDHHRVANVSTFGPIFFRNEPVGSTSTIVSKMFFEHGIRPSRETAGILCAAIISDTLLFRSPTSTQVDAWVLERMAKIAGIDVEAFALDMFKAGTSIEGKTPQELLEQDVKAFSIEGETIRVAQVFTMDMEYLESVKKELITAMNKVIKENGENTFVLMLTDIFNETSIVLAAGDFTEEIAAAFDKPLVDNSFEEPGLLSRKKQMIPKLNFAISNAKA
ncbi:putative manganese-dependent inorganic diphosphatase [Gallicola sp. Sow4_E12]|uniref:putative manganese-dependent inorganic diphosphatase n=1 Tax=Gallicola sp. Sow4_E12 TaxID=3438785 RepID=UPI003F938DB0